MPFVYWKRCGSKTKNSLSRPLSHWFPSCSLYPSSSLHRRWSVRICMVVLCDTCWWSLTSASTFLNWSVFYSTTHHHHSTVKNGKPLEWASRSIACDGEDNIPRSRSWLRRLLISTRKQNRRCFVVAFVCCINIRETEKNKGSVRWSRRSSVKHPSSNQGKS